jgi:hypothetical protein
MSIIIKGGDSTNLASVDSNNNLNVNMPLSAETSGFAMMVTENDPGTVTGNRWAIIPEISADYRLRVGIDNLAFSENYPGATLNSTIWTAPVTTMTITSAGGFANINAAGSLALGAVARLQTYRHFPIYKNFTTYFDFDVSFTSLPVAGNVCEFGAFISTSTTAPTDGVFFRINSAGEFRCVINNNGTEIQSGSLDFSSLIGVNTIRTCLIDVLSDKVYFWIDDVLVATLEPTVALGSTTQSQNLPLSFRNYNATATSTAQIMKIGMVNVSFADQNSGKPWPHIIAGGGGHLSQGQTGQATLGTTALYTNSLPAGAGVVATNTTAALGSGLGGQFAVQPTLLVGTDGIISSYQVPLGSSTLPGKSLYITKITVSAGVTTALTGGPVLYALSLAYGHTAVSLQTTETATSKAPRRLPLGMMTFAATAAVGVVGNTVDIDLTTPILVQPGEFVQVVAKNLGVVTSAGVITFIISFGGYWE